MDKKKKNQNSFIGVGDKGSSITPEVLARQKFQSAPKFIKRRKG